MSRPDLHVITGDSTGAELRHQITAELESYWDGRPMKVVAAIAGRLAEQAMDVVAPVLAAKDAEIALLHRQVAIARAARPEGRTVALVELARIVHAARSARETVNEAYRAGQRSVLDPIERRLTELRTEPRPAPFTHANGRPCHGCQICFANACESFVSSAVPGGVSE